MKGEIVFIYSTVKLYLFTVLNIFLKFIIITIIIIVRLYFFGCEEYNFCIKMTLGETNCTYLEIKNPVMRVLFI